MEMKIDSGRQAELARSVDCFTAEELRTLAGITEGTEVAWAKRGTGPRSVMLGNVRLYPREAVAEFLRSRLRDRKPAPPKSAL